MNEQNSLQKCSKLTGVIGSLVGAIVGVMPMVLMVLLFGFLIGFSAILVPVCAYKGYKLFKGKRDMHFARLAVVISSIIVAVTSVIIILVAVITLSQGQSDISSNIVLMPIVAVMLGYGLIIRRIDRYSDPEGFTKYLENSKELLEMDTTTRFYFPEKQRLKGYDISVVLSLVLPFGLVIAAIYFCGDPRLATDQFGNCVPLIWAASVGLVITIINMIFVCVKLISSQVGTQYCFVTTEENEYYKIHIPKLNSTEAYNFTIKMVINSEKFTGEENNLFRSAVIRGIEDIKSGKVAANHLLHKAVVEMKNPVDISQSIKSAKITYTNNKGKSKTFKVFKIFPNLLLPQGTDMGTYPGKSFYWLPVISTATTLFSMAVTILLTLQSL